MEDVRCEIIDRMPCLAPFPGTWVLGDRDNDSRTETRKGRLALGKILTVIPLS
jgi:hypothetical protein